MESKKLLKKGGYADMKIKYFALSIALIFSLVFSCALAPFEIQVEAAQDVRVYTYTVEITFGPFAFYYDYGIWDVNELDYVKAETSTDPSHDTEDGAPGWYGFDGNTNHVSVTYQDSVGEDVASSIDVSVKFTLSKVNGQQITGVLLTGYSDAEFVNKLPNKDALSDVYSSGYKFNVPNTYNKAGEGEGIPTNTYFSLDGTPMVGAERLQTVSGTVLLGTITISIDGHNPAQ